MENVNYNQSLPPLEPGTLLKDGRYEILELTSNKGGFGRIYRAQHLKMHKRCPGNILAIKEFHIREYNETHWSAMQSWTIEEVNSNIEIMKLKFKREAWLLSRLGLKLKDMHVPEVKTSRTWTENGRLFYAMNFIEGRTLTEIMDEYGEGHAMPELQAIGYIIQIAKVLHKAHAMKGMTHADVSPNNIMLRNEPKDYAVLVDWGNARSYHDTLLNNTIYDYRGEVETRGFSAPKTFWGKPQRDVYSLAATLLYLLTGKKPQLLDSEAKIEEARQLLTSHNVSAETTEAILHAMNIDNAKATKSIHEFMMELPKDIVIKILLNYTDNDR